jgi:hypothetical protein
LSDRARDAGHPVGLAQQGAITQRRDARTKKYGARRRRVQVAETFLRFEILGACERRFRKGVFRAPDPACNQSGQQTEGRAARDEVKIIDRERQQFNGLTGLGNFGDGFQFNGFDVHGFSSSAIWVGFCLFVGTRIVRKRTLNG